MGRPYRTALGGYVYHMLKRANGRLPIFQKEKDGDYAAFERILAEALEHVPGMRLLAYCLLPNHWHLVVWPRHDAELSDFGHWLTLTHTQRTRSAGTRITTMLVPGPCTRAASSPLQSARTGTCCASGATWSATPYVRGW